LRLKYKKFGTFIGILEEVIDPINWIEHLYIGSTSNTTLLTGKSSSRKGFEIFR